MIRSPRLRPATPALAGVVLCAALLLGGCATPPQTAALQRDWPAHLPARVLLEQVPLLAQPGDDLCGPASLAMVAQAAGRAVSADELTPQVYLPGRRGALQVEMMAAARRHGLVPLPLAPELDALLRELAAGQPVLVLQNLSLPMAPVWHYAVAVGYDRASGELILHAGQAERQRLPLSTFEHTWARSGRWALRVAAPQAIPVTAEADDWARAVAVLERVDARAAQAAWAAALQRWPGHRASLLGAGNTAYALGQREQAGQAYAEAVRLHPDFADAWNNLAQVLLEQGRRPQALEAIARAVALGGPRLADYRALQTQIESAR